MIKNVIVTVKYPPNRVEKDVEIPIDAPLSKVCDALVSELIPANETIKYRYFFKAEWPNISFTMEDTAEEAGIWDGSILVLQKA